jgi:hypothetical protein
MREVSLAAAIQQLVTSGLKTAEQADPRIEQQDRIGWLEEQLRQAELALDHEVARRELIEQEFASLRQAAQVWARRAEAPVGTCPRCGE